MASLVVDKIKKPVNIMINDTYKDEVTHIIYLNKISKTTNEEETIRELLEANGDDSFIPSLMYVTEKKTIFRALNVSNVCYIREYSDVLVEIKKEVSIIFVNGVNLKVAIDAELARDYNRVIDYLNNGSKFMEFRSQRSLVYVNKYLVADVTEID